MSRTEHKDTGPENPGDYTLVSVAALGIVGSLRYFGRYVTVPDKREMVVRRLVGLTAQF
jgi:hypothetical protein